MIPIYLRVKPNEIVSIETGEVVPLTSSLAKTLPSCFINLRDPPIKEPPSITTQLVESLHEKRKALLSLVRSKRKPSTKISSSGIKKPRRKAIEKSVDALMDLLN